MWNLPRPTGLNLSGGSAFFEESHFPLVSVSKNSRHESQDSADEHFPHPSNFSKHDIHFPSSKIKPSSVSQEVQIDSDEQAIQEFGQGSQLLFSDKYKPSLQF